MLNVLNINIKYKICNSNEYQLNTYVIYIYITIIKQE